MLAIAAVNDGACAREMVGYAALSLLRFARPSVSHDSPISRPFSLSISMGQYRTGIDDRRFISEAVEVPHFKMRATSLGPPSLSKSSGTFSIANIPTPST